MDKDAIMGNWWPWGATWMCNWCWWVKEMEIGMSERGCGMTCGGCRKSMISSTLFYYFFIYRSLRLNPIEEPVWNESREVGATFLFIYLFFIISCYGSLAFYEESHWTHLPTKELSPIHFALYSSTTYYLALHSFATHFLCNQNSPAIFNTNF